MILSLLYCYNIDKEPL